MFSVPPLEGVILKMLATTDDGFRSVAWNLFHDHRIDSERFNAFDGYCNAGGKKIVCPLTMERAISGYHASRIQGRMRPDFLVESLNSSNFHGRSHALPALYGNRLLVRVLNLSRLGRLYAAAKNAAVSGFDDYLEPVPAFSSHSTLGSGAIDVVEWLDRKLSDYKSDPSACFDKTRLEKDSFLTALLDFLNLSRRREPFQPVWATTWTEFSSRDWKNADRWPEMLGIRASAQRASWFLLLRYPVREAGQIVRPTQLDGGWYPEHFPTPPSALRACAMDLRATAPTHEPLREYIHQQMDHTPAHLVGCARVGPASPAPLPPPQRRHFQILQNDYTDVPTWVKLPHPAFVSRA